MICPYCKEDAELNQRMWMAYTHEIFTLQNEITILKGEKLDFESDVKPLESEK